MSLPDNPLINSTLGLINADLYGQKLNNETALQWGADSSLNLATIASLSNGYNLTNIMDEFEAWYQTGKYTVGLTTQGMRAEEISNTTRYALEKFLQTRDPFSSGGQTENDNDNGALMRITPVVMYLQSQYGEDFVSDAPAMLILHQIGGLTHNHPRGLIALGLYALLLNRLMDGLQLQVALDSAIGTAYEYYSGAKVFVDELQSFERLNTPDFGNMPIEDVSASDDIVDTLEAVVWVLVNSNSYQDALNLAAQIKGNPNHVAMLVGAVAGILYGHGQLPKSWLNDSEYSSIKEILEQAADSSQFNFSVE
jgi:ADP-ribosylglycohydrolase